MTHPTIQNPDPLFLMVPNVDKNLMDTVKHRQTKQNDKIVADSLLMRKKWFKISD